jgi:hypothetical protein
MKAFIQENIPYNVSAEYVKDALEELATIKEVEVKRNKSRTAIMTKSESDVSFFRNDTTSHTKV